MLGIIALGLFFLAQIALAQAGAELPAVPPDMFVEHSFWETVLSGGFAVITENKWDNKLAGWLSEAAWVSGVLVGKFGYGTPKLVIAEKAKEAAAPPK
jgi:hypothetical protein